jgi:type III restriction enzyme
MPEQKHYDEKPELNIGYVYSASDAFTVVEELAKDYVSEQKLVIDNDIYSKKPKLISEHIRRKRELTRLSGDFKKVFFEAAENNKLKDNINKEIGKITKQIKLSGEILELDKGQDVVFDDSKSITRSKSEIQNSYDTFLRKMVSPYEIVRSQNILKTAIRNWCVKELGVDNEDKIQLIVMSASQRNNAQFQQVIEETKELYANLPTKKDEKISDENWEIPKEVNLFSETEKVEQSKKSILKQEDEHCLLVRKDKNGNSELSKPEKEFIAELEKTDDDVQWWFKNGKGENKYFSIVYPKDDGYLYGFYPDFIIKTKKETIIVEIKDNKDFKADNYYKLIAGKHYIDRLESDEITRFYILSQSDYFEFFEKLHDLDLDNFNSVYEKRLTNFV